MAGCELFKVFKRINPDFTCQNNCGSSVVCGADVETFVPEREIPKSKQVGVTATYNAITVPQPKREAI